MFSDGLGQKIYYQIKMCSFILAIGVLLTVYSLDSWGWSVSVNSQQSWVYIDNLKYKKSSCNLNLLMLAML